MKKYPAYKPSGIEWIGDIPKHWEMIKLKYLGKSLIGLSYQPEDIVEDETQGILVLRSSNIQNGKLSLNDNVYVKSKVKDNIIVREGDILICSRNGSRSLIGKNITISKELEGNTFGAFMTIFRTSYWNYLSKVFNSMIFTNQSGLFLTSTINQLTQDTLNNFVVPFIHNETERTEIVQFLDEKTEIIDKLISTKEIKIDLLKEQRTSLINQVITKGLDPDVKMKDSGVEWIGEIPEHWEITRVKYVTQIFGRIGYRGYTIEDIVNEGEGVITISPSNIQKDIFTLDTSITYLSYEKYYQSPEIMIFPNDVLLVKTGSTIGKTSIVPSNVPEMTINPQLVVLKNIKIDNRFLYYQTTCDFFKISFFVEQTGSTTPTISQEKINNFPLVVPSKIEQQQIVEYLDNRTKEIDDLMSLEQKKIEVLKEYRQSLISEIITGKIDVRTNQN